MTDSILDGAVQAGVVVVAPQTKFCTHQEISAFYAREKHGVGKSLLVSIVDEAEQRYQIAENKDPLRIALSIGPVRENKSVSEISLNKIISLADNFTVNKDQQSRIMNVVFETILPDG